MITIHGSDCGDPALGYKRMLVHEHKSLEGRETHGSPFVSHPAVSTPSRGYWTLFEMADLKDNPTHVEDYELQKPRNQQDDAVQYPECLRDLSEGEIHQCGKKATMKMDFIVMPALVIMYILNYLGELRDHSPTLPGD